MAASEILTVLSYCISRILGAEQYLFRRQVNGNTGQPVKIVFNESSFKHSGLGSKFCYEYSLLGQPLSQDYPSALGTGWKKPRERYWERSWCKGRGSFSCIVNYPDSCGLRWMIRIIENIDINESIRSFMILPLFLRISEICCWHYTQLINRLLLVIEK